MSIMIKTQNVCISFLIISISLQLAASQNIITQISPNQVPTQFSNPLHHNEQQAVALTKGDSDNPVNFKIDPLLVAIHTDELPQDVFKQVIQPAETHVVSLGYAWPQHKTESAQLVNEMKTPWEGMESPNDAPWDSLYTPGQYVDRYRHEKGIRMITGEKDPDEKGQKLEAFFELPRAVPPGNSYVQTLFDPADPFKQRTREKVMQKKVVQFEMFRKLPYHPFHYFDERVDPKNPEGSQSLASNPGFFPTAVTKYDHSLAFTDVNGNPVLAKRIDDGRVMPRFLEFNEVGIGAPSLGVHVGPRKADGPPPGDMGFLEMNGRTYPGSRRNTRADASFSPSSLPPPPPFHLLNWKVIGDYQKAPVPRF